MKPHELIRALMAREGLGALPLAKRMGKPTLQPQIHRFIKGEVAEPARTTAEPLAAFFKIPVDAIYSEKAATAVARERDVHPLPAVAPALRKKKAAKDAPFDEDVMRVAAQYAKMSPQERQRFRLLMLAARDGINPPIEKAPRHDVSQPTDQFLGAAPDSGLTGLDEIPPAPGRKKGSK